MTFKTLIVVALLAIGCTHYGQAPIPSDYETSLDEWMQTRHQSLTNPTGWMRLSGMIWIENGVTSFLDTQVQRRDSLVFHADSVLFRGSDTTPIASGTHRWSVIGRGDLIGIRVWNTENPEVDAFTGFDRFPTDTSFVRVARFRPNPEGTTIRIMNVLGQLETHPAPGVLEFDIDGKRFELHPLARNGQYFVIFADPTNRTETYQAGRFIYINPPNEGSDRTIIDFNKAYNPPCSFSEFTTCQLPPDSNVLTTSITAGEKRP